MKQNTIETLRMIDSSLALLCQSQGVPTPRELKHSTAKYFKAVLCTLPYSIGAGRISNRMGAPVGVAVAGALPPHPEKPRVFSFALYGEGTEPWLNTTCFNAYMKKLAVLVSFIPEEAEITDRILKIADPLHEYGTYREYVKAMCTDTALVVLDLHGRTYSSAVATVHQVLGEGNARTRKLTETTLEVKAVCN